MTDHIELYKKYRPRRWDDFLGQDKVARSLQAAVLGDKIPTAFLFAGPRGCGKTSAALVLAKAINCLALTRDGNPCNECEVCVNIDEGRQLGVTYFSAANKSGVDDVRELVVQARLRQPIRRTVFIIDEIHNLKQGKGFEALLIPLEEKDMPALFIFCTTEIEKVPATILSRVQQRRFNLVDQKEMLGLVEKIDQSEGFELGADTLADAVRKGRGSVRDTLTALESIVATGEMSESFSGQLLQALSDHDLPKSLSLVAQSNTAGESPRMQAEQLFEDFRDLLLVASNVDREYIGLIPLSNEKEVIRGLQGRRGLIMLIDEIGKSITQMSYGADERINFEIGLVKCFGILQKLEKLAASRG